MPERSGGNGGRFALGNFGAGHSAPGVDRIVILLSAMVLVAAWVARWWFWWRVREKGRRTECGLSVGELRQRLGLKPGRHDELRDAAALGSALRDGGLRLLEKDGVGVAKKRRAGWWSLRVLPGLAAMVLVFSAVTRRVPVKWVLAVACALVAVHVVLRVSGLPTELRAVRRARAELEKSGGFRRMSEEAAVLDCARASVWETVLPW
jgi:hypothetical protein